MRESNLKFFTIQAHKVKELDKCPLWLEVTRRFIRSSEFETPFGLKLLAFSLNEIMQNNKISSLNLELSREVDKQGSTKPGIQNREKRQVQDFGDSDKDDKDFGDSEKDDKDFGDSDKDVKDFNTSNNTAWYSMDVKENKTDGYSKKVPENLLSSSDTTSSSNESLLSLTEEKSSEDVELDRLLRLASTKPSLTNQKERYENKRTLKPKPQEKAISEENANSIKPKLSLLDCFGFQNNEESNELLTTRLRKEDDFVKQFNSEIKNLFLFSSESCPSDVSELENEETRTDKNVKKIGVASNEKILRKAPPDRKRRKNDLQEYRISTSEEDEEESHAKVTKKRKENNEMMAEEEEGGEIEAPRVGEKEKQGPDEENCDIISDSENSVEMVLQPEIVEVNEVSRKLRFKGRKNINKILDVKNLQLETKLALKMEMERNRRLKERQEIIERFYEETSPGSKLVLDFDPDTMQELVVVDENLTKHLKSHQREGVRFMWNCCFESLKKIEQEKGSGCVLAHCMGLGKTLQVIAVIHSALTHSPSLRSVLIICPLITVRNWFREFKIWTTSCSKPIRPFSLGSARNKKLGQLVSWTKQGGVLIISYEMFRVLVKKEIYSKYRSYLLDPGPDIVVCDEGHLMKNPNTELSKCVSRIRTLRRIVLTGTPLQNNLIEYYCMVQFVKPNLLGTKKEFMNRFVNPITNGQFENSTQRDVFIMKQRSHVLHTLLQSFVQRLGYDVLEPLLPKKQEFVVLVALTDTQEKLYSFCMNKPLKEGRGLLWDFHWCHKIWTHPLVVKRYFDQNNFEEHMRQPWESFIPEYEYDSITSSNKLRLLFSILKKCREVGDKVLVFSQSLYTLGLIENFLLKLNGDYEEGRNSEYADVWVLGQDYFKLTGSTKLEDRETYYKRFSTNERARLFLISTKAGGLGINLVAANRVVLFDASWNPAHDLQSIFRIYRFGQKKPCYIYRFLAAATMEEKIYKRQITKLSLAHRILDEYQIERHYSSHNLFELYTYDPLPKSEWKVPKIPKDQIFAEILSNNRDIVVGYHEHNSLLENKEEEELTEEERQAAWENYEKEKASPQKVPPEWDIQSTSQCLSHEIIHDYKTELAEVSEDQKEVAGTLNWVPNGYLNSKNLLELGNSFGLKPYPNEEMEVYLERVECALKNIFPWGTPKVIIQGDLVSEE